MKVFKVFFNDGKATEIIGTDIMNALETYLCGHFGNPAENIVEIRQIGTR